METDEEYSEDEESTGKDFRFFSSSSTVTTEKENQEEGKKEAYASTIRR